MSSVRRLSASEDVRIVVELDGGPMTITR